MIHLITKVVCGAVLMMTLARVVTSTNTAFDRGGPSEDRKTERAAQRAELSPGETAAFKVCAADLSSKTFNVEPPTGTVLRTGISRDVRICHARAMVRIFRDNRCGDHGSILADMAGTAAVPRLDKADFRKPATPARDIMDDVRDSLMDCTLTMRAERIATGVSEKVLDLVNYD